MSTDQNITDEIIGFRSRNNKYVPLWKNKKKLELRLNIQVWKSDEKVSLYHKLKKCYIIIIMYSGRLSSYRYNIILTWYVHFDIGKGIGP